MKLLPSSKQRKRLLCRGFTLPEVATSMGILGITVAGIMTGFVTSTKVTDYASCSGTAQRSVAQQLEQTRAAKWDPMAFPQVCDLSSNNFPQLVSALDVPGQGTNIANATVTTTISDVSFDPPVKMISVACVWSLPGRGPFTNSITTYRSPDQ